MIFRFLTLLFFACSPLFSYSAKNYTHLLGMPGFNDELLQIHFKLYEGYVKNANDLLGKLQDAANPSSYEIGALRRRLGWEFDGMRLHELYFENLGGKNPLKKENPLYAALVRQFGSFEKWKRDFIATGMMRGIGWALLYYDPQENKLINVWINEHVISPQENLFWSWMCLNTPTCCNINSTKQNISKLFSIISIGTPFQNDMPEQTIKHRNLNEQSCCICP